MGKTCDKLGAIKATVAWTGVSILSFLLLIIGGSNETVSIIAAGVNDVMFAIVGTAMPMLLLSLLDHAILEGSIRSFAQRAMSSVLLECRS